MKQAEACALISNQGKKGELGKQSHSDALVTYWGLSFNRERERSHCLRATRKAERGQAAPLVGVYVGWCSFSSSAALGCR